MLRISSSSSLKFSVGESIELSRSSLKEDHLIRTSALEVELRRNKESLGEVEPMLSHKQLFLNCFSTLAVKVRQFLNIQDNSSCPSGRQHGGAVKSGDCVTRLAGFAWQSTSLFLGAGLGHVASPGPASVFSSVERGRPPSPSPWMC